MLLKNNTHIESTYLSFTSFTIINIITYNLVISEENFELFH